jgi:phosphoenolpyruvate synthase/pyruvate phosphate dikinase
VSTALRKASRRAKFIPSLKQGAFFGFYVKMKNISSYILGFQEIDKTKLAIVGGKGANLGELSRIEGIHVPDGFCISTEAFKRIIGETSSIMDGNMENDVGLNGRTCSLMTSIWQ